MTALLWSDRSALQAPSIGSAPHRSLLAIWNGRALTTRDVMTTFGPRDHLGLYVRGTEAGLARQVDADTLWLSRPDGTEETFSLRDLPACGAQSEGEVALEDNAELPNTAQVPVATRLRFTTGGVCLSGIESIFVDEGAIGGYSVLARARGSALDGHATTEPIARGVARPTRCRRR